MPTGAGISLDRQSSMASLCLRDRVQRSTVDSAMVQFCRAQICLINLILPLQAATTNHLAWPPGIKPLSLQLLSLDLEPLETHRAMCLVILSIVRGLQFRLEWNWGHAYLATATPRHFCVWPLYTPRNSRVLDSHTEECLFSMKKSGFRPSV